jgi:hypothetical protein
LTIIGSSNNLGGMNKSISAVFYVVILYTSLVIIVGFIGLTILIIDITIKQMAGSIPWYETICGGALIAFSLVIAYFIFAPIIGYLHVCLFPDMFPVVKLNGEKYGICLLIGTGYMFVIFVVGIVLYNLYVDCLRSVPIVQDEFDTLDTKMV